MASVTHSDGSESTLTALSSSHDPAWQYLCSLIHELRSVLTTVKISAEILASPRADDADYRRRYSSLIAEQTGRVARLLDDFSEVYRPGLSASGEISADLTLAAEAAVLELSGIADQVQVSLSVDAAPLRPRVAGDQAKISSALRGFLEYLLGVVPAGSRLEVSVTPPGGEEAGPRVTFAQHPPAGQEAFAAPEWDWGRVNLAAARQIVETHGGQVTTGGSGEDAALLTVSWPRAAETAALSVFARYAKGRRRVQMMEDEVEEAAA